MLFEKIFKDKNKSSETHIGIKREKVEVVGAKLEATNNELKEEVQMKSEKHGDFLLWNLSDLEARDLCKNRIDAMEKWSRRLIDEKFKETYGDEYFETEITGGQPLVKASIKRQVESRMNVNPGRFARKVDALVIEDLEYFFCRDDLYKSFFKEVFEPFFSGQQEVRTVLKRISGIRNKIAHGNHLSQHELEQGVCYPNDFIAVFISYYKKIGKEKVYNVPTFLSVRDSLGRIMNREDSSYTWEISDRVFSYNFLSDLTQTHLRSGDTYRIILEVDASFPEEFYEIKWYVTYSLCEVIAKGKGNVVEFKVDDKCVSYTPCIYADLVTKRSWHRFAHIGCDDHVEIRLSEVFPPIEDECI